MTRSQYGFCQGDRDFFDAHALHALLEVLAINAVAIANEKTWCFLVREGVDDLLGGPFGLGICGDVEVDNLATIVTHHDESVQNAESDGRHREEVTGSDIGNVIVQKRSPGPRRRFPSADHVFGYGRFGSVVAQQKQLG